MPDTREPRTKPERDSEPQEQLVDFGLGGAWGFASNLTSPARAGGAGAFLDSSDAITEPGFTELRVHGVSGSNGPTMLEHPDVLQVAGDSTTMFYRRWSPQGAGGQGIRWRLEAYSWGGLTEAPLASASWLLLAPFMFYNLAHFALPQASSYTKEMAAPAEPTGTAAQMLSRDRRHGWAQGLLRVLALTATLQFTTAIVSILVAVAALQAGQAHFPSWLSWFPKLPPADRVMLAVAGVALVIAVMWQISERTAHRYEARSSQARPVVNKNWPLTQTGFWKGEQLVRRQRSLHAAGAVAVTALAVSRPGHDMGGGRAAVMWLAAVLLAVVVASLCLPLADRQHVTLTAGPAQDEQRIAADAGRDPRQQHDQSAGTWWCRAVLAAGAAVLLAAFFTGGWPGAASRQAVPLSGFTNICAFLLAAQALLLLVLAALVWVMARRAPDQSPQPRPFAAGHLTTVVAALAICLGGTLSAVLNLFVTRLLGTPVPSGLTFSPLPAHPLQVPWPLYAFAAAPAGLIAGLLVSVVWIAVRWLRHTGEFAQWTNGGSAVSRFYGAPSAGTEPAAYRSTLRKIASAWSVGLLADETGVVFSLLAAGMVIATGWAEIAAATARRHAVVSEALHGLVSAESLIGLLIAGGLVALLRSDFSDQSSRKSVGAIWDVATFWPRAAHPFAPPCYAERAVPELVDRLRLLTGTVPHRADDPAWQQIQAHLRNEADSPVSPAGPVLLTGYSQGSIITPAVIAQLPDPTLAKVALLTLACPASRLYGRAFPAYFGKGSLRTLAGLLEVSVPADSGADDAAGPGDGEQGGLAAGGAQGAGGEQESFTGGRWKNLVRPTDYIGSFIFRKPGPAAGASPVAIQPGVDQPCWDPVSLAADIDPTPPAIHRHTTFWPDPRVTQLGQELGRGLSGAPDAPGMPGAPRVPAARSSAASTAGAAVSGVAPPGAPPSAAQPTVSTPPESAADLT
jgi:hypothetical protein